jgi:hypothetical protein
MRLRYEENPGGTKQLKKGNMGNFSPKSDLIFPTTRFYYRGQRFLKIN